MQPVSAESPFALLQRKAKAYASSTLVPKIYQDNIANVIIAMEIAQRIGANELMVMQNLAVIQGKPSWSSTFLIATVNACGRFKPMRFEVIGDDPKHASYKVRAYADDKSDGERCVGPWITWEMVKEEGWLSKSGSKWKTMPELMFMYRAAGFWTRVYAPEVSMGIHTAEEVEDIGALRTVTATTGRTSEALQQIEQELTGNAPASDELPPRVAVGEDITAQSVHDRLAAATDRETLDRVAVLISTLDPDDQPALLEYWDSRAVDLAFPK